MQGRQHKDAKKWKCETPSCAEWRDRPFRLLTAVCEAAACNGAFTTPGYLTVLGAVELTLCRPGQPGHIVSDDILAMAARSRAQGLENRR